MGHLKIKRGDTLPPVEAVLKDADGVIDLSGATVRMIVKKAGQPTPVVDAPCVIVDAEKGKVRYDWQAGQTDDIGRYEFEFEITFGDGNILSVPNDTNNELRILQDLG